MIMIVTDWIEKHNSVDRDKKIENMIAKIIRRACELWKMLSQLTLLNPMCFLKKNEPYDLPHDLS